MSYIVRNEYGAFCSVCQSPLGLEEDDWDECDACGGEGIGGEDYYYWSDDPLTDEEHAMIERQAEALSGGALWWSNWARENGLIIPNPKPSLADKIRTMIAQDGEGAAEKIAKMMEGE